MSSYYTGWSQPLMVTLTATSNPYLAPKLPLRGELRVLEMRTDHYAQPTKVSFLQIDDEGNAVGTRVMVDRAEWTYTLPPDRKEHQ